MLNHAPKISSQLISARKISAKNFDLFRRRKISAEKNMQTYEQAKISRINLFIMSSHFCIE